MRGPTRTERSSHPGVHHVLDDCIASAANSRESEKFYSSLWARRQQDNTAQSLEISILHILGTIKSQLEKYDEAAEIFIVICSVYLRNMSADDRLLITKMGNCLYRCRNLVRQSIYKT